MYIHYQYRLQDNISIDEQKKKHMHIISLFDVDLNLVRESEKFVRKTQNEHNNR